MATVYRAGIVRTVLASGAAVRVVLELGLADNEVADIHRIEAFTGATAGRDRMMALTGKLDDVAPTTPPQNQMNAPDKWWTVSLEARGYTATFDPPQTVGGPQLFVAFNNGAGTDALLCNIYYTKRKVSTLERAEIRRRTSYGARRSRDQGTESS